MHSFELRFFSFCFDLFFAFIARQFLQIVYELNVQAIFQVQVHTLEKLKRFPINGLPPNSYSNSIQIVISTCSRFQLMHESENDLYLTFLF